MVKNKDDVRCSFCGKNTNEVFKMIAGNDVFICDECVEMKKLNIEMQKTNRCLNY